MNGTKTRHVVKNAVALLSISLLANAAATATAVAQTPAGYAARIQLDTQRCGPFCRIALPPEVYRYSAAADLSDLRVVDAQGKVQPFARAAIKRGEARSQDERAVAVYPVNAPARAPLPPGVRLRMDRAADGAMRFEVDGVSPVTPASPQVAVVAYVIDTRELESPTTGLRLTATFPAGRLVPIRIERSRDLGSWESIASEPVYRLDGAGATLERSSIRFRTPISLRDSFVRVTWPADVDFDLKAAHAWSEASPPPARIEVELAQTAADARSVEWELPAPAGWDAVELKPAGRNAWMPLTLQARRAPSDPWVNVGRGVVYRIGGADGGAESVSPPLTASGGAYRRLRAVVDDAAPSLETPPKARVLYGAEEVVVLLQGTAPFSLIVGHAKPAPAGAAIPLTTLLPDYRPGAETKVPVATLAGVEIDPARSQSAPTLGGFDVRTVGLWVVLVAAVLLLSLFAYSLLRKVRATPAGGEGPDNQTR